MPTPIKSKCAITFNNCVFSCRSWITDEYFETCVSVFNIVVGLFRKWGNKSTRLSLGLNWDVMSKWACILSSEMAQGQSSQLLFRWSWDRIFVTYLSLGLDNVEPWAVVLVFNGDVGAGLDGHFLLELPAPHLVRDRSANDLNVPGVRAANADCTDHLEVITDDPRFHWK